MKNSSLEEMNLTKRARASASNRVDDDDDHDDDDDDDDDDGDVDDDETHANLPAPVLPHPHRAAMAHAKTNTIAPPFDWATDRRAKIYDLNHLLENNISTITGIMECKKCKNKSEVVLDLENKFHEVFSYIENGKDSMNNVASNVWLKPVLQTCRNCRKEGSVQPLLKGIKKRDINWLFLFLCQLLGCCGVKQLRYYLKHNDIPSSGRKDRILYSVYIGICKQLRP